jgi:hypothetical protein
MSHGYLRTRDGSLIKFNVPGGVGGTFPTSINPRGEITGYYLDASSGSRGFVRARDGTFTTFQAPGAGTGFGRGTLPLSINPTGEITGNYFDANFMSHGFLRK